MAREESQRPSLSERCIFCGQPLGSEEAVRYRGALSHKRCADEAAPNEKESWSRVPFIVAAIGGFLAIFFSFLFALAHTYLFGNDALMAATAYGGLSTSLLLLAVGFFGYYANNNRLIGLLPFLLALPLYYFGMTAASLLYHYGFIDPESPLFVDFSNAIYMTRALLAVFLVLSAVAVLLALNDQRNENLILVTTVVLLLSSPVFLIVTLWILPVAMFLTSCMFLTIKKPAAESPISPL